MRVNTFTLTVTFDPDNVMGEGTSQLVFNNLSRVAVKRYKEWYEDWCFASFNVEQECV